MTARKRFSRCAHGLPVLRWLPWHRLSQASVIPVLGRPGHRPSWASAVLGTGKYGQYGLGCSPLLLAISGALTKEGALFRSC